MSRNENIIFGDKNKEWYEKQIEEVSISRTTYDLYQDYLKEQDEERNQQEVKEAVSRLAQEVEMILDTLDAANAIMK